MLAPQIDFRDRNVRVPRYRYAKIPLNNLSSSQVALGITSPTLLEWKIPASTVCNLNRSYVAFSYSIPAVAASYGVNFEGVVPFRQVSFGPGSGQNIVDLNFADQWCKAWLPVHTKLVDFMTQDQIDGFYPCSQDRTTNLLPFSRDGLSAGTQNASSRSFTEQQYLTISALNTALNVSKIMPLKNFVDTFLSADQDVPFGTDMFLRLWFNPLTRLYYYTTSPNNPSANVTVPAAAINLTNIYLHLAIEENLEIRNSLMSALAQGEIKMTIPFMYAYRLSVAGASTSASASLSITKNYGRCLKRFVILPCNGQENTNLAYDHSNVNGTKLATFQVSLSGRPLSDRILNSYNPNSSVNPAGVAWNNPVDICDDFMAARQYLQQSALQGYASFQSNWFYAQSFGELPSDIGWTDQETSRVTDGLDLLSSGDHTLQLSATCPELATAASNCNASGLILYIYCLFLRTLSIRPDGIILSA